MYYKTMTTSGKDNLERCASRAVIVNVADWAQYDISTLSIFHEIWDFTRTDHIQSNFVKDFKTIWGIEKDEQFAIWKLENSTQQTTPIEQFYHTSCTKEETLISMSNFD